MTSERDDPFEAAIRAVIGRYTEGLSLSSDGAEALEALINQMVASGHREAGDSPLDDASVQDALLEFDSRLRDSRASLAQREVSSLDAYDVQELARRICPLPPICYGPSGETPEGSRGTGSGSETAVPIPIT